MQTKPTRSIFLSMAIALIFVAVTETASANQQSSNWIGSYCSLTNGFEPFKSYYEGAEHVHSPSQSGDWQQGLAIFILDSSGRKDALRSFEFAKTHGANIAILIDHLMIGWVDASLANELAGKSGIRSISFSEIDLSALPVKDETTIATARYFNEAVSGRLGREIEKARQITGDPLSGDGFPHPEIDIDDYHANLAGKVMSPSLGNSDAMTGTVAVALFFLESTGSIDANVYTWTSVDQQNTFNRALSGFTWWANKAAIYGYSLTFTPVLYGATHPATQIGYEPILHPSGDNVQWATQVMANLGFTSGNNFTRFSAFNTALRNTYSSDWAYSVIIGYNPSPAPSTFTDGHFAFTWMGGPYIQMLFNNDGWGENNFGMVFSHETGHDFWACDEYYQPGYGGCTSCGACASGGPRPTILNGNCEYCNSQSVACMMKSNSDTLCAYSRDQIGWLVGTQSSIQFSSTAYNVGEGDGYATITVTRTGGTSAVGVNYATSNGTATAGSDYTAVSGTLSFAVSETTKTFNIPVINDTAVEGNETVNIALSNPTGGATLGTPSTAVLTIIDDDVACTYSIYPPSVNFSSGGGSGGVNVTAPAGCPWTAVSNNFSDSAVADGNPRNDDAAYSENSLMTAAFSEDFANIATLPGSGWYTQNNSVPVGSTSWFQGNTTVFTSQSGNADSYIGANFNATTGVNTISEWLLTPTIGFNNGDVIRFWTRTVTGNQFPDRLQVRLSLNGSSTNVGTGSASVGDFTGLITDINPTYTVGGYPEVWTQYTVTMSGLSGQTYGRLAFRYFVENGGPNGDNSNYIGIDSFSYTPSGGGSSWITVTGGSSGVGPGTVGYFVAANSTGVNRLGTITIAGQTFTVNQAGSSTTQSRKLCDFDGDNISDLSIFRPSNGQWWWLRSSNGTNGAVTFGASTDRVTPGDFTGDGKSDFAIFRPYTGQWYVLRSEDFSYYAFPFGTSGDVPVPGYFDSDAKVDAAVFRPSNSTWYISRSTGGTSIQQFGSSGDVPVAADYDGDGIWDRAIYRPSVGQWWLQRSSLGTVAYQFGASTDKTVQGGDFTGDGKADITIWRPSTGQWFVLRSENQTYYAFTFGISSDLPVAGDYDGDGKQDAGVFRPSTSTWYIQRSAAGTLIRQFGTTGDLPLPNAYVR